MAENEKKVATPEAWNIPSETKNRLKDLKNNIEPEAKEKPEYKELETTLDLIKKILRDKVNKPTNEEIISAKAYLDNLIVLKQKYNIHKDQSEEGIKSELGNLKEEFAIYKEIRQELEKLEREIRQSWALTLEQKLLEKNGKPDLEVVFNWTKTSVFEQARIFIDKDIEEQLMPYNLSTEQKNNIKIGIVDRIVKSWDISKLFLEFWWWVSSKFNSLIKWDLKSVITPSGSKDSSKDKKDNDFSISDFLNLEPEKLQILIKEKLKWTVDASIKNILDLLKQEPKTVDLTIFLSNPKAISEYEWWDISWIKNLIWNDLVDYLKTVNAWIISLDSNISALSWLDKTKDMIMETISNLPFGREIIKFLLGLTFIWALLAALLWFANWEEAITELWKELDMRNSVKILKSFWKNKDKDGKEITWKNNWDIPLLKDRDLSNLDFKKIKTFLKANINEWADINNIEFWKWVFEWKFEFEIIEWENKKVKTLNYPKDDITKSLDSTKFDDFYGTLNKINFSKDSEKPEEANPKTEPETAPVPSMAAVATWWAAIVSQSNTPTETAPVVRWWTTIVPPQSSTTTQTTSIPKPPTTEEVIVQNNDLPKSIDFNPESSIATIDWKDYRVDLKTKNWSNITIKEFEYKEWNLNISWYVAIDTSLTSWNSTFGPDKIKVAYAELKSNSSYKWVSDKWYKLSIQSVA